MPRLAALQEPTLDVQLQRWWSRRYGRPPNDPLYAAETQTFWLTEFYRDCLDEAYQLKDQIEQMPSGGSGSKTSAALRGRLMARFRALQTILKGESASPVEDQLAIDIAAQKRGDLPDFIRRKMQRQTEGEGGTMGRDPASAELGRMPDMMRQKLGARRNSEPTS